MKIAIDCRTILNPGLGEGAGVGSYTLHLVEYLLRVDEANEYILFLDTHFPAEALRRLIGGRPAVRAIRFGASSYRKFLPGIYSELLVSGTVARERPDVFHVPGGRIPVSYRGATVLTVHDLAIFHNADWFPKQKLASRVLYPKTIAQASHLIAVSHATRHDLETLFAVPHDKITVISEGVSMPQTMLTHDVLSHEDVTDRHDLERFFKIKGPYLLYLGTLEPRKNIIGIINAFDALLQEGSLFQNYTLVLAGGKGWHTEETLRCMAEKNTAYKKKYGHDKILYLGYVSERTKWALLKNAHVFVFPSFYEGFGLPVLEAMSQGVPTITSKVSSLPEITGTAALLIDPASAEALTRAMRTILLDKNMAAKLGAQGKTQAAQFTWERTAIATRDVYEIIGLL